MVALASSLGACCDGGGNESGTSIGNLALGSAAALGAAVSIYWYYLHQDVRRDDGGIPGSRGLPFVGETLRYASEGPDEFVTKRVEKYQSPIFSTSFFGSKTIVVASSDLLSQLLKNERTKVKAKWQGPFLKLFGEYSILNVEGQHHKVQREAVLRVTNKKAMESYAQNFAKAFQDVLTSWKSISDKGESIDVEASYTELTFNSNARYLFGEGQSQRAIDELRELFRVWKSGFQSLPVLLPGFQYYTAYKAWGRIADIMKAELEERKANPTPGRRQDLADIFSANINPDTGEPYEFEPYLRHQLPTIMFGSLDTTVSTELGLMLLISQHPHKLLRVRKEVIDFVQRKQGTNKLPKKLSLSYTELTSAKELPYLHAFIQEAMRVHIPGTFNQREAVTDFSLNVGNKVYKIFKGDGMIISIKGIADNIEGLKDKHSFRPERFLEPEAKQNVLKKNSLVPFGAGLRQCPGWNFAMTQVLTIVATLAYEDLTVRFQRTPVPVYDPTLVLKEPAMFMLEPLSAYES